MEMPARKPYVLRLPTKERVSFVQKLPRRFSYWLNERSKRQGKLSQEQEFLDEEVELSMNT